MAKKLFLIDGSNHAFRAQFALPPRHASDGFPTRVLYGFTLLFQKMMRTYRPDYCVVSFDSGKTFRHDEYPKYKGHRPDMPDDLRRQWPFLPTLVEAFGFPCIQLKGYEADDVLGAYAVRFASEAVHAYIVSSDKDFSQLVGPHISLFDESKDTIYDPAAVEQKHGIPPEQFADALGLAGDSSDNIPGVPGVGMKTAAKLLIEYGDISTILAAAAAGKIKGKRGEKLREHAADALLSRRLATIAVDAPVPPLNLEDLAPKGIQEAAARELFDRWEFGMVARKLLPKQVTVDVSCYRSLDDDASLHAALHDLRQACPTPRPQPGLFQNKVVVNPLSISLHHDAEGALLGAGLCWAADKVVWLPLQAHDEVSLAPEVARAALSELLADASVPKIAEDSKTLLHQAHAAGMSVEGMVGDTRLLDYVLVAHRRSHALDTLAQQHLGHTLTTRRPAQATTLAEAVRVGAEPAHVVWLVFGKLRARLPEGPARVLRNIELPLVPVLAQMERAGIGIDLDDLAGVRVDIQARAKELEARCHTEAGGPFKVSSTKEVARVLFEQLGLTPGKKLKTGFSTDSKVLESLVDAHPLPATLLAWRSLSKLDSTYLKRLPDYVAADGRIHTTFQQAVAATGRLSSTDPNLQNIPIRTVEGRRIRRAFVAAPGHHFLSADYSQVELRVLAHFCGSDTLQQSFRRGEDIHRRTASEVFGVAIDEVSGAQRSAAKAVNFGLVYGMSAFRLGRDLHLSRSDAQAYMDTYFERLPQVKAWIEATHEACKRDGLVETLYGRRRLIPEIYSKSFSERKAAEREAVNTRVQGTAADIIKIAMVRVARRLKSTGCSARMLLQVHDELLLEVPDDERERVRDLVVGEMESAAPEISVPLSVMTETGRTWSDAHD